MTPQQFIARWKRVTLSERSACQQHFLDLCRLLDHPTPAEADPEGTSYTFERGVRTTEGHQGWADVWKKDHFGWEYKKKRRNLDDAYRQLLQYREDLNNPPLLVVCDMDRFEVHTNFTGTAKKVYAFDLDGLAKPDNLAVLRKLFADPQSLKPGLTAEGVTRQASEHFGGLADGLRQRGIDPHRAAHFLMKLMFCMFAEDIGLLKDKLFTRTLANTKRDPDRLATFLSQLFQAMSTGGYYGPEEILHFNGGLFADADVIALTADEIDTVALVNRFDWGSVEPSIFGTLFERTLDPAKRSQIGAHYTSREDIETLLEPVMLAPLRREWEAVRARCDKFTADGAKAKTAQTKRRKYEQRDKALRGFVERLAHVTVLDPACGSGNFLYVALHLLLTLEKEVIAYAARHQLGLFPQVRPTQLHGIEINPYAQELAQVAIWIGYLQWMRDNGFNPPRDPVLEPIESIECRDAILDPPPARGGIEGGPVPLPAFATEPEWPAAEFIVGNPPFLGGKLLRSYLGDDYVNAMFALWKGRVRPEADLCCYWFEKARRQIERGKTRRAGLLATQGIRGGANRETLKRIKETGDVFFAESDREWILNGAAVHISMIGFDDGSDESRTLDGAAVATINANLTATSDVTAARRLDAHRGVAFMGDTKGGAFDIPDHLALEMLKAPNPHGRPNSDVIVPWINGLDVTRRPRSMWIIDFDSAMTFEMVAGYESVIAHVEREVKAKRASSRSTAKEWWLHDRPRPEMRAALAPHSRFIATTTVSKHRLFVWEQAPTLPDHQLIAFARSDDYFFGILHSRVHEVWARAQGTQVRERESGFRYTPTTCFETFPFPEPSDEQRAAIATAAAELDRLRNAWLNPPEWTREEILEFPGSTDGPWQRYIDAPSPTLPADGEGVFPPPVHGGTEGGLLAQKGGTPSPDPSLEARGVTRGVVRYPRTVPTDEEHARQLARRTLTNLYNNPPTWLSLAHEKLDAAVFAAYGWDPSIGDDKLLGLLLNQNLSTQ
ncbi:MAG: DNA methyltransferase [Planctomycetales bacterium]